MAVAIIFNNVSPGAARAHDPDGFGDVYHRAFCIRAWLASRSTTRCT